MIVTGAFTGPVIGESPIGTVNLFSSAEAMQVMTIHTRIKNVFFMNCDSFPGDILVSVSEAVPWILKRKNPFAA
jgi:hypothetical protein